MSRAQALAASVAKLTDREPMLMYYRKVSEGRLLSIVVPTGYPASVMDVAAAFSIADVGVVATGHELDWRDGELISAVDASPAQLGLVASANGVADGIIRRSGLS
jgi:hypothetical protein